MKKSFGVRKSQQPSLLDSIAGRTSIIPNRKTFFQPAPPPDPVPQPVPVVTPTEEPKPMVEVPEKKDDTITIIDTELHLGEQRLKTKFTTDSQRIFDALNSLKLKSTPGQSLREGVERMEAETPAPVRSVAVEIDEEEDWIPKRDYSSLVERLQELPVAEKEPEPTVKEVEPEVEIVDIEMPPPVVEKAEEPMELPAPIIPTSTSSPVSATFISAAAQAAQAIRNAMATITHDPKLSTPKPTPQPTQNVYPNLDDDVPMADIEESENFTVHYDRTSLDSNHDSAYFTQSDRQPSQPEPTPAPQPTHPPQQQAPRAAAVKPKPALIRVPTASQRQKEQAKKALQQVPATGIYPTLTQSRSVPDLATPGKMSRDDARGSDVSVRSMGYMRGAGIKALNAAKLAKQRVNPLLMVLTGRRNRNGSGNR
jgi:hypothetical protein